MTLDRAIRLARSWAFGGCCTLAEGEAQEYHKMALEAFLEQETRNKNKPLTIEELRQMDGEPVWCPEHKIWGIVKVETVGRWKDMPFLVGHRRGVNYEWDIERRQLKLCRHKPGGNILRKAGEFHEPH